MKRFLILLMLLCGAAVAVAQTDSVDFRLPAAADETLTDASMSQMIDVSFPTELAVSDFEAVKVRGENRYIAAALAIVLGDFGIHHFYTGDIEHGLLHAIFFWTGIPAVIGIIEGIMWLADPVTFPDSLF